MIRSVDQGNYYSRRGRGRPTEKHADPDYKQVTSYVRRQTYAEVRLELVRERKRREFSELVEGLLSKWLKSRG